jgi:5-methyltetrahydrofolate--homocysteine methyltransferase
MDTIVKSPQGKEVIIGEGRPTVLIGERINPFGKGPLKEAMKSGDLEPIRREALKQVEAGADILIISVATFGIDETVVLPQAAKAVMETVDVPLCLESRNPQALEKALTLGLGKPIISSVTGEDPVLDKILPLVKQYGTALVAMTSGGVGIPKEPQKRLEIARQILDRTGGLGIPREDLLLDCLAESSAVNDKAVLVTLETMETVKRETGVNLVLGTSNVSFGLPNRLAVNAAFLSLAIRAGLNCAIVDAARMKPFILAVDLLLGRDRIARRYTNYHRQIKKDQLVKGEILSSR